MTTVKWSPKRRYSAAAVFSDDLERVVLIHRLKPAWQAGKANVPGGKVEDKDWPCDYHPRNMISHCRCPGTLPEDWENKDHRSTTPERDSYARGAARELAEETGLVVDAAALTHFCTLRFHSREGDDAECRFYCTRGDVEAARTMEEERVFVAALSQVIEGEVFIDYGMSGEWLPIMPNLPYLVAMAQQCLRGSDSSKAWPLTIYENGATP